jgi:5,10-methylenetetrahydromethanopterin reductase
VSGDLTFSVRIGGLGRGIDGLTALSVHAEALGFDQVWVGNDFLGHSGIPAIASMLIATSRIRVGSAVLDPVSLHPGQIAQLASGFQELSGGRFLLGLGAGSDVFFSRAGLAPAKPVPRTREAIIAIRELTNGRSPAGVPGAAAGWHSDARILDPRPVPIYVGAMGPKLLQLAGRYADGALPLCLPPRHLHNVMPRLAVGAEKGGRSVDELDVAACVWCAVDDDRDVARRLLARHIAIYSGSLSADALVENGLDPEEFARTQARMLEGREDDAIRSVLESTSMLELGIVGGADEVVEQCGALVDAGARHISFGPPLGADGAAALALLSRAVVPRIRASVSEIVG